MLVCIFLLKGRNNFHIMFIISMIYLTFLLYLTTKCIFLNSIADLRANYLYTIINPLLDFQIQYLPKLEVCPWPYPYISSVVFCIMFHYIHYRSYAILCKRWVVGRKPLIVYLVTLAVLSLAGIVVYEFEFFHGICG